MRIFKNHIWAIILIFALAACSGRASEVFPVVDAQATPYIPPTIGARSTPLLESSLEPQAVSEEGDQVEGLRATPTPLCAAGLTFLSDLSIPDGTRVAPDSVLDKRWQVENSGTCNWDGSYHLENIAGPNMNAPSEQALYPARSGTQATIGIIFTAPDEPGTYRSAWQASTPLGDLFGDPFFIEIVVESPTPLSEGE